MVIPFAKRMVSFQVSEPLVDCGNCRVMSPLSRSEEPRPNKCCSFQPFWSLFQIAEYLKAQQEAEGREALKFPNLAKGSIFLPVGIVPPARARERMEDAEPKGASRGVLSEDLTCPHYIKDSGHCGIFSYRPLECRRYYCASQYQKAHDGLFQWASNLEMLGLESYLKSVSGFSNDQWQGWVDFLEPGGWRLAEPATQMSELQALSFYLGAHPWWSKFQGRVEPDGSFMLGDDK